MIRLKSVLVAVDFSEPSEQALGYGRALAKNFGARLLVLHVADVVTAGIGAGGGMFDKAQEGAEAAAKTRIYTLLTAEDRRALRANVTVLSSISPAESIVRHARDIAADVIVMGTHGRGGMAHVLMGSVAEAVVRTAPCPVLTVRHPEPEAAS